MGARRKSVPRRKRRAGRAARLESEPCATFCSVGCATGPAGYARPLRLSAESRLMRENRDRAAGCPRHRAPPWPGRPWREEGSAGPALRSCGTSRPAAVSTQVTGNRDRRAAKVSPAPEEARRKGRKAGERALRYVLLGGLRHRTGGLRSPASVIGGIEIKDEGERDRAAGCPRPRAPSWPGRPWHETRSAAPALRSCGTSRGEAAKLQDMANQTESMKFCRRFYVLHRKPPRHPRIPFSLMYLRNARLWQWFCEWVRTDVNRIEFVIFSREMRR